MFFVHFFTKFFSLLRKFVKISSLPSGRKSARYADAAVCDEKSTPLAFQSCLILFCMHARAISSTDFDEAEDS